MSNKSLRHFETFVARIVFEYPIVGYRAEVQTGKFSCAYSLKTLNTHSQYGRGYGICRFLRIVSVEFFYAASFVSENIPVYHNYRDISKHCSRNVLFAVSIDASNYVAHCLNNSI